MAGVLKQPAEALGSLRVPIRAADVRVAARVVAIGPAARTAEAPSEAPPIDPAAFKAELDVLREQGFREGLARGRAQAEEEARATSERDAQRWHEAIANMDRHCSANCRTWSRWALRSHSRPSRRS